MSAKSPARKTTGPSPVLVRALTRLLRPLVRLLVARGITFPYLAQLLKATYVRVAEEMLAKADTPATVSRLSVATGLQRKDINRLQEQPPLEQVIPQATSLGPRLVSIWVGDRRFRSKDGRPRSLPRTSVDTRTPSFEDLVRTVSSDVRPRAILEEWERLGIVTVDGDGLVTLKQEAFVPKRGADEKLYYLGRNVADHIATAAHNILEEGEALFERAVYYDGLTPESIAYLAGRARHHGTAALVALNKDALARAEKDEGDATATHRMAMGLYYYQGPEEGAAPEESE